MIVPSLSLILVAFIVAVWNHIICCCAGYLLNNPSFFHPHKTFQKSYYDNQNRRMNGCQMTVSNGQMEIWLDCRDCNDWQNGHRMDEADKILVSKHLSTKDCSKEVCVKATKEKDLLVDENENVFGTVIQDGQEAAMAAIGSVEWILFSNQEDEWKMIPAENLISVAHTSGTNIAMYVDREEDVMGLAKALELGVDALCLSINAPTQLWERVLEAQTERQQTTTTTNQSGTEARIVSGVVLRLDNSSVVADRVCIDFVQLLSPTEGCWIGSSAKVMALVLSEAAESSYVPSRPFRVNAGPVHSYVLMKDGQTTKYLSELQPGDEILIMDCLDRTTRSVAIGRLKIELRPCIQLRLMVTTNDDDDDDACCAQLFVQQAETVRLGQANGKYKRVTDVSSKEEKDETLIRLTNSGTHVGKSYTGKVVER